MCAPNLQVPKSADQDHTSLLENLKSLKKIQKGNCWSHGAAHRAWQPQHHTETGYAASGGAIQELQQWPSS